MLCMIFKNVLNDHWMNDLKSSRRVETDIFLKRDWFLSFIIFLHLLHWFQVPHSPTHWVGEPEQNTSMRWMKCIKVDDFGIQSRWMGRDFGISGFVGWGLNLNVCPPNSAYGHHLVILIKQRSELFYLNLTSMFKFPSEEEIQYAWHPWLLQNPPTLSFLSIRSYLSASSANLLPADRDQTISKNYLGVDRWSCSSSTGMFSVYRAASLISVRRDVCADFKGY